MLTDNLCAPQSATQKGKPAEIGIFIVELHLIYTQSPSPLPQQACGQFKMRHPQSLRSFGIRRRMLTCNGLLAFAYGLHHGGKTCLSYFSWHWV
jgi:hypothetical protein